MRTCTAKYFFIPGIELLGKVSLATGAARHAGNALPAHIWCQASCWVVLELRWNGSPSVTAHIQPISKVSCVAGLDRIYV